MTLEVRSPLIALGATEVALALGLCGVCIEQPLAMAETACCSTTSVAASAPAVPFARSTAPKPTLASPRLSLNVPRSSLEEPTRREVSLFSS